MLGDNPYLSYDGGVTSSGLFSTGINFGDGYQAQHWKDSSYTFPGPPFGIMDPNIDDGEVGVVTPLDILALDLIGYTLVPEPSGIVLAAMALVAGGFVFRRRRPLSKFNSCPA